MKLIYLSLVVTVSTALPMPVLAATSDSAKPSQPTITCTSPQPGVTVCDISDHLPGRHLDDDEPKQPPVTAVAFWPDGNDGDGAPDNTVGGASRAKTERWKPDQSRGNVGSTLSGGRR